MCSSLPLSSHQALEREVESESGALQQRLEIAEEALGEKERELAEARERIGNLSDELVISHGKARHSLPPPLPIYLTTNIASS